MSGTLAITGNETGADLIKQLVWLRVLARRFLRTDDIVTRSMAIRETMASIEPGTPRSRLAAERIAELKEGRMEVDFMIIEIGRYLIPLCRALDEKAPRELVFEALETNRSDRDTESVRKHGTKTYNLIAVLDLENSATTKDGRDIRPLKWCHTMSFMNALQTNPKVDRIVHDCANEFFNGVFGEFQERPLLERLVGWAV